MQAIENSHGEQRDYSQDDAIDGIKVPLQLPPLLRPTSQSVLSRKVTFVSSSIAVPRRGKLDLEKIRASLDTPCPHCGHSITPEQRTHVDTEHLECPSCHARCA